MSGITSLIGFATSALARAAETSELEGGTTLAYQIRALGLGIDELGGEIESTIENQNPFVVGTAILIGAAAAFVTTPLLAPALAASATLALGEIGVVATASLLDTVATGIADVGISNVIEYAANKGLTGVLGLLNNTANNAVPVYDGTQTNSNALVPADQNNFGNTPTGPTLSNTYDNNGSAVGSKVTTYNGNSATTNYYSGLNESGSVSGSDITTYNFSTGVSTTTNYSGANGSGSVTGADQENPNGTSVITTYNPNTGSHTITSYNGPNGGGMTTSSDQENADGTSAITIYNSNGSGTTIDYSGPNGTGTNTGSGTMTYNSGTASLHFNNADSYFDVSVGTSANFGTIRNSGYFYQNVYSVVPNGQTQVTFVTYLDGGTIEANRYNPTATISLSSPFGAYTGYSTGMVGPVESGGVVTGGYITADNYITLSTVNSGVYTSAIPIAVSTYLPGDAGGGSTVTQTVNVAASGTVYGMAAGLVENGDAGGITLSAHVGGAASHTITIENAASGTLTDTLNSLFSFLGGNGPSGLSLSNNTLSNLSAGASGSVTLTLSPASNAGYGYTYLEPNLSSHDSILTDVAAPTNITTTAAYGGNYLIPINEYIYNYAAALLANSGGVGTLVQNGNAWTLSLGTVQQGAKAATVAVTNTGPSGAYTDTLNDSVAVTSGGGFTLGGATSFTGLAAGATSSGLTITPVTTANGTNSETLTFSPISADSYSSPTALASQTLTITDTVTGVSGPQTYVLSGGTTNTTGTSTINTAQFQSPTDTVPDQNWLISQNAGGNVVINGTAAGYNGTATLSNIQQVELSSANYALSAPPAGAQLTTGSASQAGDIVVDNSGGDQVIFNGSGNYYWHTGNGGDSGTLQSGNTEVYLNGNEGSYTYNYSTAGSHPTLVVAGVAGTNLGTNTLTLAGGTGDLVFSNGQKISLGNLNGQLIYGTSGSDTLTGNGANDIIDGEGGNDTLNAGSGSDVFEFAAGDGQDHINGFISGQG